MMSNTMENLNINIKVVFFSSLKNIVGQDFVELKIKKKSTVLSILQKIQEEYFIPKNVKILQLLDNELEIGLICLINDVDISIAGGLQKVINSDTIITLITSLHGG